MKERLEKDYIGLCVYLGARLDKAQNFNGYVSSEHIMASLKECYDEDIFDFVESERYVDIRIKEDVFAHKLLKLIVRICIDLKEPLYYTDEVWETLYSREYFKDVIYLNSYDELIELAKSGKYDNFSLITYEKKVGIRAINREYNATVETRQLVLHKSAEHVFAEFSDGWHFTRLFCDKYKDSGLACLLDVIFV